MMCTPSSECQRGEGGMASDCTYPALLPPVQDVTFGVNLEGNRDTLTAVLE